MLRSVRHHLFSLACMLTLVATVRAGEAEDQYAVAAGHYSATRWTLAVDEFNEFLRAHPEHLRAPQAMFFSGEALIQLARYDEASRAFERLVDQYPKHPLVRQAMFRRGESAYVAGRHEQARPLLEEFQAKYPDDPLNEYVLPYLGEMMLETGQAEDAHRQFAKAVDVYPRGALADESRLGLARADEATGRTEAARRVYREMAAAAGPQAEQAQFQLGLLENSVGDYDAALQALAPFSARFAKSPLFTKAELERGWALYKLKRWADAEACFRNLIPAEIPEKEEVALEARYWLALTLAADRRWAEAVEMLELVAAETSNPNRVMQSRAALAICYAHLQRQPEARSAYAAFEHAQPAASLWNSTTYQLAEAVFAYDPIWAAELFTALTKPENSPDYVAKGLSGLAWCQFQSADAAGSAATFDRLLAEHPGDPLAAEAALTRGQALEKLGQPDGALGMYELVIEKWPASPQYPDALWRAARVQQRLSRFEAAERLYRRLAEVRPPFAGYDALLYQWSRVLEELRQPEQAAQLLERLHRDFASSSLRSDAAYRLAEHELQLKNYNQAQSLLREIVEAQPAPAILPHALYLQGRTAWEREAWDEVRQPLERLVAEFPESPLVLAARYWIADSLYRQKDYVKAGDAFATLNSDSAGRTEKWLAMVPLRQAQAYAQQGDWTTALELASSIAPRYPDFAEQYEADYLIGRALAMQAEFGQAREAYTKVLRSPQGGKSETAAMAQWMIGETYLHQENYEAAIAAYLRVDILFAYPQWQAAALLQAGKCHEQLGHWKDAADTYVRLVQNYPASEFTDEAKRRLSVAQQNTTGKRS